uniref:PMEI domain-containing protein n=1 Tax=Caenorhabditis tropicalis TaxID=1561998 RepID=A0A1I7T0E5_9PELO
MLNAFGNIRFAMGSDECMESIGSCVMDQAQEMSTRNIADCATVLKNLPATLTDFASGFLVAIEVQITAKRPSQSKAHGNNLSSAISSCILNVLG